MVFDRNSKFAVLEEKKLFRCRFIASNSCLGKMFHEFIKIRQAYLPSVKYFSSSMF